MKSRPSSMLLPLLDGSCGHKVFHVHMPSAKWKKFRFLSLSLRGKWEDILLIKARKLRKLSCIVPRRRPLAIPLPSLNFPFSQNPIKHKNKINCDIFQLAERRIVAGVGEGPKERWACWQHVSCSSSKEGAGDLTPIPILSRQMPAPRCLSPGNRRAGNPRWIWGISATRRRFQQLGGLINGNASPTTATNGIFWQKKRVLE